MALLLVSGLLVVFIMGNFSLVGYGTIFDSIKESSDNPNYNPDECKFPVWGGCNIKNFSYNENYIQRVENKYSGSGCDVTLIHRFKAIKRGYTEINVGKSCSDYNKKYRILIY